MLAKLYSNLIGRHIDPETEILITPGAQGALHCTIYGHMEVGDEAIIIEPYFDCYAPMVRAVGGIPRFVPLRLVEMVSDSCGLKHLKPEEEILFLNTKKEI